MAWTATDLATIEAAIATGATKVRYADGREVVYNTASELLAVRASIKAAIDATSATAPSRITRVVVIRE